jgi:hypothetical protein
MILIFIHTGVGGVFCVLFIAICGKLISITSSLQSSSELASRRYFANYSRYITTAGGTLSRPKNIYY